jgi:hypothetical protein
MKKNILLWLLLFGLPAFCQQDAWVYFNEKPNAANYFTNPLLMLSQRALDRRVNQDIPLDIKDIPISQSYIAQVKAVGGITVMASSKWLNALHIRGSVETIQSLLSLPFVSQVDFADKTLNANTSGRINIQKKTTLANKTMDTQITFSYGNSNNQIQMLNGNLLHQQNYTGSGKIIAVLDAGFPGVNTAQPFQRLQNNNLILGGYDFVARNEDFYTGGSHGSMVLSTMGGYTENQLVGTAPDASYYLFITEDIASENPVEESLWVEAAEKADSLGVDIINTSLGYFGYDNPNYSYTYEDMNGTTAFASRGADIAFSRGMVVVVSAGNSGTTSQPHIAVPADAINVLTVGAVTATQQYAVFSSIGPSFDGRVKPNVMAQGQSAVLSDPLGNITTASGTSFSSPITAGMVACLWQALPDKTSTEIVQLVQQSANLYTAPNVQYGYGIPNFNLALANGLSVNDKEENRFILYPNPVDNQIRIDFPNTDMAVKIMIFNSLGQTMIEKSNIQYDQPIELGALGSGVYFYKITSANGTQSGKIIKK